MDFCLQDCRPDLTDTQNFPNLFFIKIRKTDCPYFSCLVCLFHQPVSCNIISGRLMDQQKVNRIGIQTLQCFFYRIRIIIERWPQFCFQKNLVPCNAGFFHGTSYCFFIDISICCINQPIPILQCAYAGSLCLLRA